RLQRRCRYRPLLRRCPPLDPQDEPGRGRQGDRVQHHRRDPQRHRGGSLGNPGRPQDRHLRLHRRLSRNRRGRDDVRRDLRLDEHPWGRGFGVRHRSGGRTGARHHRAPGL
ncbi:uncharacterized protein METZ01_LOCUS503280, partial [marine metagenome]